MTTEHIELPDPTKYASSRLVKYHDHQNWQVAAFADNDDRGDWPLVLAIVKTVEEADSIAAEMRKRLNVARALLNLK